MPIRSVGQGEQKDRMLRHVTADTGPPKIGEIGNWGGGGGERKSRGSDCRDCVRIWEYKHCCDCRE